MATTIIFGGSFDPFTYKDLKIAEEASRFFDAKVNFLAFKEPNLSMASASYNDRVAMVCAAINSATHFNSNVLKQPIESFLIAVDALKNANEGALPSRVIFLVDPLNDSQSLNSCELGVISEIAQIFVPLIKDGKCYFEPLSKVSSLSSKSENPDPLQAFDCPESVLGYMETHRLYNFRKLASMVSEHRYLHSVQVAKLSRSIAKANNLPCVLEAYVTGLFHDCAKDIDPAVAKKLIENDFPNYKDFPAWTFHEFIGSMLAKENFDINNLEILDAIASHATGKKDMSTLGKIVYAADKIEPTRGYDSSLLIKECLRNYEDGFKLVLKENKLFLEKKGYVVDNALTKECFEYYLGD